MKKITPIDVASWVGMIGILAFYPLQNAKAILSGNTIGLSLPAFVCLLVGTVAFATLGKLMKNWQMGVTNGIASLFTVTLLAMMVL